MNLSSNRGVLYLEFCLGGHNQTIPQNGVPVLYVRATETVNTSLNEQPIQLPCKMFCKCFHFKHLLKTLAFVPDTEQI